MLSLFIRSFYTVGTLLSWQRRLVDMRRVTCQLAKVGLRYAFCTRRQPSAASSARLPTGVLITRRFGKASDCTPVDATVSSTLRVRRCIVNCNAQQDGASTVLEDGEEVPRERPGRLRNCAAEHAAILLPHPSEIPQVKLKRRAHLIWDEGGPRRVLIVKKHFSEEASKALRQMADWLKGQGLEVMVEEKVQQREYPDLMPLPKKSAAECRKVDLCIALGGDGTFLHMAGLFGSDEPLPPAVSFAMGTLGFLTPFDVKDFKETLACVLAASSDSPVFCTLRTRKTCKVYGRHGTLNGVHHVLNECLIDRGANPSMVNLECFIDGDHVTTIKADGLIIATPSGSTAYSLSVGGPMVAPSVPCALLTPIAPHSLSFRPLVVPESSDILIHLPCQSRRGARASFDGRSAMELEPGSSIQCHTSECPMPVVNLGQLDHDWYEGITQKLKWNDPITGKQPNSKRPKMPQLGERWQGRSPPERIASVDED